MIAIFGVKQIVFDIGITLTTIMKVKDLFVNFFTVNIGGYPLLAPFAGITFSIGVVILSGNFAYFLINKKQIV
ncbi:hypothetical protein AM500_16260 [Bacillus sp. FJAT-18017]|nr:hypothetical protein AM500_16260 [Bacillus sp. FJAT-18017]